MEPVASFLTDTSGPFAQLLAAEQTAQSVQAWIQEKKDAIRAVKKQAIEQDFPFNAIYDHLKQLDDDIRGFKRLLQSNEASRIHWRTLHLTAWRATARPLKVLDLPGEILTMVFAHFEDVPVDQLKPTCDELPRLSPDVASIKSIRLTCRAFCDSGSRFLLPVVNISFTRSSLQRLEDISSHSLFSKGVRIVRVNANPYNASLVRDRYRFMSEATWRLISLCGCFERDEEKSRREVGEACRLVGVMPDPHFLENNELDDALAEARRVLAKLHQLRGSSPLPGPPDPFNEKIIKAIDQAHEEYSRQYQEQQNLINDCQVLIKIVIAVRQMPSVRTLCIPDPGNHRLNHKFTTGWDRRGDVQKFKSSMMKTNPLWDLMVQTGDREGAIESWDEDRPFPLLYKLPFVLQAANKNLTTLDINLPPISRHYTKTLADHLPDIQRSCQNLKHVRIKVTETPWNRGRDGNGSLATTFTVLGAMLVSPRLEKVSLCYLWRGLYPYYTNRSLSIGPVLANLPWNRIRSFRLEGFSIKLVELRELMEKVPGKICLELYDVKLLEGPWPEALDILRGRADSSSRIVNYPEFRMWRRPRRLRDFLSEFDSEHRDGWYSNQRCPGPASFYIRGGNIPNPLKRPSI